MVSKYIPKQGDIIFLNFNPQSGKEQAGKRPGLVVSDQGFNNLLGLLICCPITKQKKGYPFEVEIPKGIAIEGIILTDHMRSIDWRSRKAKFVCKAPEKTLEEALEKIRAIFNED